MNSSLYGNEDARVLSERYARVLAARIGGASFREIADTEGVTIERARQIYFKAEERAALVPSELTTEETPILQSAIPARIANALANGGIKTWEQLRERIAANPYGDKLFTAEGREVKNIGPKAITVLRQWLARIDGTNDGVSAADIAQATDRATELQEQAAGLIRRALDLYLDVGLTKQAKRLRFAMRLLK
jgi:hypothetical protein